MSGFQGSKIIFKNLRKQCGQIYPPEGRAWHACGGFTGKHKERAQGGLRRALEGARA